MASSLHVDRCSRHLVAGVSDRDTVEGASDALSQAAVCPLPRVGTPSRLGLGLGTQQKGDYFLPVDQ